LDKQVAIRTLTQLKQRLYAQAARSIQQSPPHNARVIQQHVDAQASHIAYVINLLTIKL
jgi:hypothetical protein